MSNTRNRGARPAPQQQQGQASAIVQSVDTAFGEQAPDDYALDDDVELFEGETQEGHGIQTLDPNSTIVGQGTERLELDPDNRFDPAPPQDATTTRNFEDNRSLSEHQMEAADEVVLDFEGIVVDDIQPQAMRTLRTNVDVGPCYYGQNEFELKKGALYRVPEYIFEYCMTRNLIWSLN